MYFKRVPKQIRSRRHCLRICWNSGFGETKLKQTPGESRHQPGWAQMERGSHEAQPEPGIRLLPPSSLPSLRAIHEPGLQEGGMTDEAMCLVLLYLFSTGSEQPLFGCLFIFHFHPRSTHTLSVAVGHALSVSLPHPARQYFSTVANIQPQGRCKLPGHTTWHRSLRPAWMGLIKLFYLMSRFPPDISLTTIGCRKF